MHDMSDKAFVGHNFLHTTTALQESYERKGERGARETEQRRGPRQRGNHIQFLETADMIHYAFSSSKASAARVVHQQSQRLYLSHSLQ